MTKRLLRLSLLASLFIGSAAYADISINLLAGEMYTSDGTTPIPQGSLIQLIVSTQDTFFTPPSATSFTGGSSDDIVLASFGSNNFAGAGTGSASATITFSLNAAITTGDPLLLRWYPTLTTSSSAPGAGTTYGQFRTDAVENNSDIGWFVPADNGTYQLVFQTQSLGGSEPNTAGRAAFVVAIPEPSSITLLGLGVAAVPFLRRRKA